MDEHFYRAHVYAEQNRSIPIQDYYLNPDWKDPRFAGTEQVVFGKKENCNDWFYSDRLWQWDREKAENAWKIAKENETPMTANFYSAYLSAYLDKKVEVGCILSATNRATGYTYHVYGIKPTNDSEESEL